MPYYARYGAINTTGIRMAIGTQAAQKLIDLYF
jgi:hypothetical protein